MTLNTAKPVDGQHVAWADSNDARLGIPSAHSNFRNDADFASWGEQYRSFTGAYQRACRRLEVAEIVINRVNSTQPHVTTTQVLNLPPTTPSGPHVTIRTRFVRSQYEQVITTEVWDGGEWNELDVVTLGEWRWTSDVGIEQTLLAMAALRLEAQRQAVAIIS